MNKYKELFFSLTESVEAFISIVKTKKSSSMVTDEWTVKDELCHIAFWHENYAANYESLSRKENPPLPQDMSTINIAGVLSLKNNSINELIKRLRDANKSLYYCIVVKEIPRMIYSKGGRVYESSEF